MRVCSLYRLLLAALIAVVVGLAGCGGGEEAETPSQAEGAADDSLPFDKQIEAHLNRTIDRLRYGDRSGLWEDEFEYIHQDWTFSQYLDNRNVRFANADSLKFIEVRKVERYDMDSAVAKVTFHFEGPTGKINYVDQVFSLYYHNGRWIKPTISSYTQQAAIDSVREEAIKAAQEEAEG